MGWLMCDEHCELCEMCVKKDTEPEWCFFSSDGHGGCNDFKSEAMQEEEYTEDEEEEVNTYRLSESSTDIIQWRWLEAFKEHLTKQLMAYYGQLPGYNSDGSKKS